MKSFGPVPSRQLGHSLEINNIPQRKVYMPAFIAKLARMEFNKFNDIIKDVLNKVAEVIPSAPSYHISLCFNI